MIGWYWIDKGTEDGGKYLKYNGKLVIFEAVVDEALNTRHGLKSDV
ncbi:MAG: hypothetical protein MESAZ_01132 [Saezia sanguinis]